MLTQARQLESVASTMRDQGSKLEVPFELFFPTLGVGLLDFNLNSSPRPELFSPGLLLAHPWSAQPQSVPGVLQSLPGVPSLRVSLKCSECPRSAQPKVSHTAHPWSAQPQSVPGVPSPRVSLPREGGDVRSQLIYRVYRVCRV